MNSSSVQIVVLDSKTLNPGDLSWDALESLGACVYYERTAAEDIVSRSQSADVVLTNKVPFTRSTLEKLPQLKYIGVTATGYNIIDVAAAADCQVTVTNAPSYGSQSVAQMAMAHVLNLANGIARHAAEVARERWASADDWCFWDHPLVELQGQTMGIVGLGEIGQATARLAQAFGMRVVATTRTPKEVPGVECVGLDELIRSADVISLHCPLTPDTENLINAERIQQMKPTALLINTGRGQLVDSAALAAALNDGRIAGAGIDTLEQEPPPEAHPLASAKNCFVTPHIAWATQSARRRLLNISIDNLRAFLSGSAKNVVSP